VKLEAPDICLLDIGLPNMDGKELARRLRAWEETHRAVLIAVSGYGQGGYGQGHDRASAFKAGFDHHFVKPADTKELVKLLNEIDKG
jgi:CheY-like chemotaxis protein